MAHHPSLLVALLPLLAACSTAASPDPEVGVLSISADTLDLGTADTLHDAPTRDLVLGNAGEGAIVIRTLRMEGDGADLLAIRGGSLPLVLSARSTATLTLGLVDPATWASGTWTPHLHLEMEGTEAEDATLDVDVYLQIDCDADGDGAASAACAGGTDCADDDDAVLPGAAEFCDGWDNDCDGEVDDPEPDVSFCWDGDGDGYGDPDTWAPSCMDPEAGWIHDCSDCNDADPDIFPGAPTAADGQDRDCDGSPDWRTAAFLMGHQCDGDAWAPLARSRVASLVRSLDETVTLTTLAESDLDGASMDLSPYDVVLFTKCGVPWDADNAGVVEAMQAARDAGTHLFLFDDDLATGFEDLQAAQALVLMREASSTGRGPSEMRVVSPDAHPAVAGPYGAVPGFRYGGDVDVAASAGMGESVLGTLGSSDTPTWSVLRDADGIGTVSLLANLEGSGSQPVGADAQAALDLMVLNSLAWLLSPAAE